ncbi:MAG: DUF1796 family putative cysteine peptidase [Acidocella sp.]|nr:DUF1796 family putative cysteine peptidase [Acidocella sp.]
MRHLIGLGFRCDVAFQLRMHAEENVAHFFDWLATPVEGVIKIIDADFDVFHPDHLVLNTRHKPNCVEDLMTGVKFHHQFPLFNGHMQPDFLLYYETFIKKFRYLAERFRLYIETKPVTLVRQGITREQALRLEEVVLRRFPQADVKFLYVVDSGEEFTTPLGHARLLKNDHSSLGDPAEWARVLGEEGLIGVPYRHGTVEILGAAHDDHNLSTDNRFTDKQLLAAIAANPQSVTLPLELANWYALRGQLAQAEEWAVSALARAPSNPAALFQATSAQWRLGRISVNEAAETLCTLANTPKALPSWLVEAATVLHKAGQTEKALAYVNQAIMRSPLDQRGYLQKAMILNSKRDIKPLGLALESAMRLGNVSPMYQHIYATVLEHRGEFEAAAEMEQKSVQRDGRFFPSRFTLAGLLMRLGRYEEALEQCEAAEPVAGASRQAVERRMAEIKAMLAEQMPSLPSNDSAEVVKLVIWDLDETFWEGTLTEGGITPIQKNIELIKALSRRGIINSICSKNDFAAARKKLEELDIWEHFVFPRIEFAPKGALVRDIIESMQLRAPSVLFVDDNVMNLREALHYSPELQIAEPVILDTLVEDRRFKGNPDDKLERLARYKVLEQKKSDHQKAGGDNHGFLRGSGVRISFHYDVMEQFPRIHDLVNRSNQLNFTKNRWPEGEAEAREFAQKELFGHFDNVSGYIKVADRYGNYGICGFFLVQQKHAKHFVFSCRAMNMGVEQLVWHKLGQPTVRVTGEVSSSLGSLPDWITVVDDADSDIDKNNGATKPSLFIRGACDLSVAAHYLRRNFELTEEFAYPYKGWLILTSARSLAIYDDIHTPQVQAFLAKIPGLPSGCFNSKLHELRDDVYVLSFSLEALNNLYRSRSTGLVLPLNCGAIPARNFSETSYETIAAKLGHAPEFSPEEWAFMQEEFEFVGFLNPVFLAQDVTRIFKKLHGKRVIVVKRNTMVGASSWTLSNFGKINDIVLPIVKQFGYEVLDIGEFVKTTDDLVAPDDNGAHYSREVYIKIAQRIEDMCQGSKGEKILELST